MRPNAMLYIQSDWNETLRAAEGSAWVTYKPIGHRGEHGTIVCSSDHGLSPPEGFTSDFSNKSNSIKVTHHKSNLTTVFTSPAKQFTSVHLSDISSIDASAGGLGVSASGSELHVWDANTGIIRRKLEGHVGEVYTCGLFPSGLVVLSGGSDMRLKIWSAETGQCAATLTAHTAAITDTAVVDRGRNVISVSKDGSARLWDCGSSSCLGVIYTDADIINSCSISSAPTALTIPQTTQQISEREVGTEDKILALGAENGFLSVIAIHSRQKIHQIDLKSAVNRVMFIGDNLVAGCQNGALYQYDVRALQQPVMTCEDSASAVTSLACTASSEPLVGRADGSVTRYHTSDVMRTAYTGSDNDRISSLCVANSNLYAAARDGIIRKYVV